MDWEGTGSPQTTPKEQPLVLRAAQIPPGGLGLWWAHTQGDPRNPFPLRYAGIKSSSTQPACCQLHRALSNFTPGCKQRVAPSPL